MGVYFLDLSRLVHDTMCREVVFLAEANGDTTERQICEQLGHVCVADAARATSQCEGGAVTVTFASPRRWTFAQSESLRAPSGGSTGQL